MGQARPQRAAPYSKELRDGPLDVLVARQALEKERAAIGGIAEPY